MAEENGGENPPAGGGGGSLSIAERRALRKAARLNSQNGTTGEEEGNGGAASRGGARSPSGRTGRFSSGGGGGAPRSQSRGGRASVGGDDGEGGDEGMEMSIAERRARRRAARMNSQNSTTSGDGEGGAGVVSGDEGEAGGNGVPARLSSMSDRRQGRGGYRGRRFASNNKRKLKRQKTKWEENMGIIDELLIPGSKTFEAMTARQRERLWDVKKSLMAGGRTTGETRTQHVPKELINAVPVVVENEGDEDDEETGGLGEPQDHPGGRRTSNAGRQKNSDFILREYAGINRQSLIQDLNEIMESSEKEAEQANTNIIEEEEGSDDEDEEKEEEEKGTVDELLAITDDSVTGGISHPTTNNGFDKNFIPQEFAFLPKAKQEELFHMLSWESIASWDFDVFKLQEVSDGQPLLFMGWAVISAPFAQQAMAKKLGITISSSYFDPSAGPGKSSTNGWGYTFMEDLSIPSRKLCHYLRSIQEDYNKVNPYHNAIHAADVLQTMHCLIQKTKHEILFKGMSSINLFAILLAAVVHDVEHPGKTNGFHVNTRSELALVHNDASVLENHHVAHAFATMFALDLGASYTKGDLSCPNKIKHRQTSKDDENSPNNLLCNATREQFEKIRKLMIEAILHTDMTKHFEGVNAARGVLMELKDNGGEYEDPTKKKEHSWTILMYTLHMADISSQAKGPHLFSKWTERCLEEFFLQGDVEKELGLPVSALCDRNTTSVPESQVGFIQFVVEPAFGVLGEYSTFVKEKVLPIIYTNLDHWSALQEG